MTTTVVAVDERPGDDGLTEAVDAELGRRSVEGRGLEIDAAAEAVGDLVADAVDVLRTAGGALRPGITGQAQINSYDGMSTEAKAAFDGDYARQISLWTDIKIILLTVRYLLKPPPVY